MTSLEVVAAGPCTTVQDAGRLAWQHVGVSPSGFADPLLAALANALVGNPPDAAVLEWTLAGDTLRVRGGPVRVAVAAWAPVAVDGRPVPAFRALRLDADHLLHVGALTAGRHGVLAIAGGVQTPLVLGSRAVHVRTGIGGKPFVVGDRVPVLPDPQPQAPVLQVELSSVPRPLQQLRVRPGPQPEAFASAALPRLLNQTWRVTAADRMGVRFACPALGDSPLRLQPDFEPISEGAVTGAIQVPPSGLPIALGPDRQTMGGYAKLAVVITADLRHLSQLREGDAVRFAAVDSDVARAALLAPRHPQMTPAHDVLAHESSRLLRLLG